MRFGLYSHLLQDFVTTAQAGSINRAAPLLYVTPTALLKRLNTLENNLQVRLFERSAHGLTLTAAGRELLHWAPAYIRQGNDELRQLRELAGDEVINIGTSPLIGAQEIVRLFLLHQQALSRLRIRLVPFDNEIEEANDILFHLGERIDVVTGIYDDRFLRRYDIRAYFLSRERLQLCVPISSDLAALPLIKLSDLKGRPVMMQHALSCLIFEQAGQLLREAGAQVQEVMLNIEACNQACHEQIPFVNIAPWSGVHPLFCPREVDWDLSADFGIIYAKEPKYAVQCLLAELEAERWAEDLS